MPKKSGEAQPIEDYDVADVKTVHPRKAEGKKIKWVYDCDRSWERYAAGTVAPDGHYLFNFDLPVGKLGNLLVLDNYGDEVIPDEVRKNLFGSKMFEYTIGIFRKTGEVVQVGFLKEFPKGKSPCYSATFTRFQNLNKPVIVPHSHVKRLDELKSKKRPFYITVGERVLFEFITRWASYENLQRDLVVDLHFDTRRLQVSENFYREVAPWEDIRKG